ncbi:hypothetical protein NQ318_022481 [Aromia moschata]|uniref:GIY-YIG domain-containing protein n=1 Tax=Aromia moschata TaxID=1265417 RepID=A0AAV8Z4W5_9CUCU|nr:hypothetical protein NQ318_022481 [Aromia moschata]
MDYLRFETEVKDKFEYFPRIWFRYVDDIFAVFDTKAINLDNLVAKLNNRFPTIQFRYEVEHNEQLPFLDVLVIRNSENKLEFDVYRKETAILRYIPKDSHHLSQHKMASFNFLIHRLLNFPLKILTIRNLLRYHMNLNSPADETKFLKILISIWFIILKINYRRFWSQINNNEKSGIYEISCKDCDQKYIGQTKRSILTRFKEHMAHLKYGRTEKSCVAQHAFDKTTIG